MMPEQVALTELAERRTDVSARRGRVETEVADLSREQRKADADVEQVKTRRTRNRERIEAGLVSDPKQLQAMEHETQSLGRRISDLEDAELEVMERLEGAQSELDRLTRELAELDEQLVSKEKERDEVAEDISHRQIDARAERERLVGDIPANLLTLYDRLRGQLNGVGVGALRHKRCGGCQLEVGAADLARMTAAPPDEVLRCEECDRILVRTPESGLAKS